MYAVIHCMSINCVLITTKEGNRHSSVLELRQKRNGFSAPGYVLFGLSILFRFFFLQNSLYFAFSAKMAPDKQNNPYQSKLVIR